MINQRSYYEYVINIVLIYKILRLSFLDQGSVDGIFA